MSPAGEQQALDRAAAPLMAAISEDERRAPRRLRPLFAALRELMFFPELRLSQILERAGLDDPEIWNDFREQVGEGWDYVRYGRFETAARLLLQTSMSIRKICELVGYSSHTRFRDTLGGFLGMPASRYRRLAPRLLERAGPPPEGADTREYWERVTAGELSGAEARELDAYLERLAPGSAPGDDAPGDDAPGDGAPGDDAPDPPAAADGRWRRARETLADGFVDTLGLLEPSYRRRLMRDAVAYPDLTLFERLGRESRDAAADDPERAVEWAQLAVDSLTANHMIETHPQTASLARARLALARWRAGDVRGAIADVKQSMRDDERAREAGDRWAAPEAERSRVTAAFYWFGGRRRDALTLAEGAVAAHRVDGMPGLRKALILRAEVRAAVADLEDAGAARREALVKALADLEEARASGAGEPPGVDPPGVDALATLSLWLRVLVLLGDPAELAVALPRARARAADLGDVAAPRLQWFEGHCSAAAAGRSWSAARDAFAAAGDELWSARLSLDLARLRLRQERAGDAAVEATKLVSSLGTLATDAGDSAALTALARAAAPMPAVTGGDLDAVERVLKRLEWEDRARRRALELAT